MVAGSIPAAPTSPGPPPSPAGFQRRPLRTPSTEGTEGTRGDDRRVAPCVLVLPHPARLLVCISICLKAPANWLIIHCKRATTMKQALSATFMVLVLMRGAIAEAQGSQEPVLMQLRSNFEASKTGCNLFSFVAAPAPNHPEAGSTLCAMGGPFGAGMVGTVAGPFPKFAGPTIHLDRTVSFSPTDAIHLQTDFVLAAAVVAGPGGINYFSGSWKITGGTGAFAGLAGQGTVVNAIVSTVNPPPPPQYAREEFVGWAIR